MSEMPKQIWAVKYAQGQGWYYKQTNLPGSPLRTLYTRSDLSPSAEGLGKAKYALRSAQRFIENGREMGYIKMPEDSEDPAWQTITLIDEALKLLEGA